LTSTGETVRDTVLTRHVGMETLGMADSTTNEEIKTA
jgi:beta-mannosidase